MMRKKSDVSQSGNQNLAIVNSKNITVNQVQAADEMQRLVKEGKLNEAAELLSRIQKAASSVHPAYPHYRFEFGTDEKGNSTISHVPNYPEAVERYPFQGSMRFVLTEKYKRFKNMQELVQHSYEKQEKIELDALSFKTWVGDTILDEFSKDNFKSMKLTLTPQKFPPPTPMRLFLKNDSWGIDYLEIGVTEIDGSIVKMDNSKQKGATIFVSFVIDMDKETAKFNIKIKEEYIHRVKEELIFTELLLASKKKSNSLVLKFLETDADIIEANSWGFDEEIHDNLQYYAELLSKLKEIENHFQVEFKLDESGFSSEDIWVIELLYSFVIGRNLKRPFEPWKTRMNNKQMIQQAIDMDDQKPQGFSFHGYHILDESIKLFECEFVFHKYEFFLEYIRLVNKEKLRKKLEFMDEGESLIIEFSGEEKRSFIYEKLIENEGSTS
jgi:hypothetical protein